MTDHILSAHFIIKFQSNQINVISTAPDKEDNGYKFHVKRPESIKIDRVLFYDKRLGNKKDG